MPEIKAIFFDVGGVFLSNGWSHASRKLAAETFSLEWEDFEQRHQFVRTALETGRLTLDAYIEATVFFKERSFSRERFKEFMRDQSKPFPESLTLLADLAASGRYFLATLNNESRELNQYRIEKFGLQRYFQAFFSSSFLGVMKPDQAIYRLALDVTQYQPDSCLFVDDRPINVEGAARLGMQTIRYQGADQLREAFERLSVGY